MRSLFAYGSLMSAEVFQLVTGSSAESFPAQLHGYSRYSVEGESYPAIVEQLSGSVSGILYQNLSDLQIEKLDQFEGEEYERITASVVLDTGEHTAEIYRYNDSYRSKLSTAPWSFEKFCALHLERFIEQCKQTECRNTRNSDSNHTKNSNKQ